MKSAQAKKREFSQKARKLIWERDNGCIFCKLGYHMEDVKGCGATMFSIMHYIPRSKNGLGIPANGAVGYRNADDRAAGEKIMERYKNMPFGEYARKLVFDHFEDVEKRWREKNEQHFE